MSDKEYAIVAIIIIFFVWLFASTAYAPYEHSEKTEYEMTEGNQYGTGPYSY